MIIVIVFVFVAVVVVVLYFVFCSRIGARHSDVVATALLLL